MDTRAPRLLALLLIGGVALAACGGASPVTDVGASAPAPLGVDAGEGPLPAADFPLLADPSTTVSTTDWLGTPTVVNFWATWCGFCLDEMPDLQAAHVALGDAVRFVGIDRQDPRDDALAFVRDTGVTYLQVTSADGAYFPRVRARGMPTTLFVDADGQVRFRHTGPLDEAQVLELVSEHLGVAP
jgi:cytochrome c biogenesis protein CcmG/thiol:disulfide interchange protein DsbE